MSERHQSCFICAKVRYLRSYNVVMTGVDSLTTFVWLVVIGFNPITKLAIFKCIRITPNGVLELLNIIMVLKRDPLMPNAF